MTLANKLQTTKVETIVNNTSKDKTMKQIATIPKVNKSVSIFDSNDTSNLLRFYSDKMKGCKCNMVLNTIFMEIGVHYDNVVDEKVVRYISDYFDTQITEVLRLANTIKASDIEDYSLDGILTPEELVLYKQVNSKEYSFIELRNQVNANMKDLGVLMALTLKSIVE